jgi:hypothetical protein
VWLLVSAWRDVRFEAVKMQKIASLIDTVIEN